VGGIRPTFWRAYDDTLSFEKRFEEIMHWLSLPAGERPALITVYLEEGNSIGHKFGPASPEMRAAVKLLDDRVGALLDGYRAKNIAANVVIVSDHGMTPISADRVVLLDDFVDLATVQVDFDGSVVGLRPNDGNVAALVRALSAAPHARVFRTEDLPPRFRISANPRNPPVWIVPDEGWEIFPRSRLQAFRARASKADHGYDNALDSMRGILIAHGPAFKSGGRVLEPTENVHIYNMLCAVLRLKPAPNDGDQRLRRALLR
jgi:predicted AlkP superfamily pyrophosphatase or phosphodiesterase